MIASRRRFLFGAGATAATLVAAPAIVRVAANLMPVSARALLPSDVLAMASYEWKQHSLSFIVTQTLRNRSNLLAEQIMKNNALLQHLMEQRVYT